MNMVSVTNTRHEKIEETIDTVKQEHERLSNLSNMTGETIQGLMLDVELTKRKTVETHENVLSFRNEDCYINSNKNYVNLYQELSSQR